VVVEEVMFNGRCTDPSLDELLGDTAMRLLMRRDGVTESDIRALLSKLKDARAVAFGVALPKAEPISLIDEDRREPSDGKIRQVQNPSGFI